jgi:hypothetical protein
MVVFAPRLGGVGVFPAKPVWQSPRGPVHLSRLLRDLPHQLLPALLFLLGRLVKQTCVFCFNKLSVLFKQFGVLFNQIWVAAQLDGVQLLECAGWRRLQRCREFGRGLHSTRPRVGAQVLELRQRWREFFVGRLHGLDGGRNVGAGEAPEFFGPDADKLVRVCGAVRGIGAVSIDGPEAQEQPSYPLFRQYR